MWGSAGGELGMHYTVLTWLYENTICGHFCIWKRNALVQDSHCTFDNHQCPMSTYLEECVLEDERQELDDGELRAALEPPQVVPHERPQEVRQLRHEPEVCG